ncbi:probable low affinity copper uptake protein 2 [Gigantopelta aegis]|uniref:probable low affinity copper uptake protein 2 n=1 Tax=Gigantopelta aegis TaxID=1735272 RepID=UPI001B88DDB5|nr:probable low affinity copper uptake protein 2 [Gigantopelta aegis]
MDETNHSTHYHVDSVGEDYVKQESHHAYFTTKTNTTLMFEVWVLGTIPGISTVLAVTLFLAVFYEGIKFYLNTQVIKRMPRVVKNRTVSRVVSQIWKTTVHILHFTVGYAMMLCVMTYNIWVLVVVTLGSGIGYYFFSTCAKKPSKKARNKMTCMSKEEKIMYRSYVVKDKAEQGLLACESVV